MDTKNGVDLEDLIGGMDLSEEWGEQNLDLKGYTDTKWLEGYLTLSEKMVVMKCSYLLTLPLLPSITCGKMLSGTSRGIWDGNIHQRYMQLGSDVTVLRIRAYTVYLGRRDAG